MRVEGKAAFVHETQPFGGLKFSAEIIPDTPQEHEALLKLDGLTWRGAHCFVEMAIEKQETTPENTGTLSARIARLSVSQGLPIPENKINASTEQGDAASGGDSGASSE